MTRSALLVCSAFLLAVTATLTQASDGIRVASGALTFASQVGHISISGQANFSLEADVDSAGGSFNLDGCDCAPGAEVSVFANWAGLDVRGTASLRGQSFVIGSEDADAGSATVTFDGTVTMPPLNDSGTAVVTAPFTFEGHVTAPGALSPEPLTGGGTVTIELTKHPFVDIWIATRATYSLEKKPATP